MKKEIFAALLLLLLLVFSLINIGVISQLTEDVINSVDSAISAAKNENWDDAEKFAEKALAIWAGSDSYTHVVLRHGEIDTVSDSLYDFLHEVYQQSLFGADASSQAAIYHLNSISSMEHIRFGSIF